MHGAGHSPAVDEDARAFLNVPATDQDAPIRRGREFLGAALRMNGPYRPDSGLRVVDVHVDAETGGERADEPALRGQRHQFGPAERLRIVPPLYVRALRELQRHRRRGRISQQDALTLQEDGAFPRGQLQGVQQVLRQGNVPGRSIQRDLPGKGPGETGAAFHHHVPEDRALAAHGAPHTPFRKGIVPIGLASQMDHVPTALRQDQPAVVGAAPRRGVHAGERRVGAHPERHAVAVAAGVDSRVGSVGYAVNVEPLEPGRGIVRQDVRVGAPLGGRVRNAEEELRQIVALRRGQRAGLAFVVDRALPHQAHGGPERGVHEEPGAALLVPDVAVGRRLGPRTGRVDPAVGITGNPVPVVGRGVSQTANRHGRAGRDLGAALPVADRRIQDPDQLVGVAVGMAALAREGAGGRRIGVVEGDAPALDGGMRRIIERHGPDYPRGGWIRDVDLGDGVGYRVEDPRPRGAAGPVRFEGNPPGRRIDAGAAEHVSARRIDGEEPVRPRGGNHERGIVRADLNRERSGQRPARRRMDRWQRFQFDEHRRTAGSASAIDPGDPIQEGAVLHLGQPFLRGAGAAIGIVPGIGLRDEDPAGRVDGQTVEQRAHGAGDVHEGVVRRLEDVQVPVGDSRVLDDIDVDPEGQHVVVVDHMPLCVERAELTVLRAPAPRDLGLVVGLEGDDIQKAVPDDERARILRRDGKPVDHVARAHVDHGDLVLGRESDVRLGVARKGNAHRLVEAGRPGFRVEILNRGDNLQIGEAVRVGVDHAHRVRDMVRGPHLETVRPHCETDGIDADVDPGDDAAAGGIDDVHRVGRRVRNEDVAAVHGNRRRLRTVECRMPHIAPAVSSTVAGGLRESQRGCDTRRAGASVRTQLPGVRQGECRKAAGSGQHGLQQTRRRPDHRSA